MLKRDVFLCRDCKIDFKKIKYGCSANAPLRSLSIMGGGDGQFFRKEMKYPKPEVLSPYL